MGDASNGGEFGPGDLLFLKRTTVHALPRILEEPVVSLSSTRRDATRKTSSSSTLKTARRKALSDERNHEICTHSIFRVAAFITRSPITDRSFAAGVPDTDHPPP